MNFNSSKNTIQFSKRNKCKRKSSMKRSEQRNNNFKMVYNSMILTKPKM